MAVTRSWLLAAALIVAGVGILLAIRHYRNEREFTLPIEEIVLGTPRTPEERTKADPKLKTQASYTTLEPIALRVVTSLRDKNETLRLKVRLLTSQGLIEEITPAEITVGPATSVFCCWEFPIPGSYALQVFRSDAEFVISLPLRITSSS